MIKKYKSGSDIRHAIKLSLEHEGLIRRRTDGKVYPTDHEEYLDMVWAMETSKGTKIAHNGHYLIWDLYGECHFCNPYIFVEIYEEVE